MTIEAQINRLAAELHECWKNPTGKVRPRMTALKEELARLWALRRAERVGEYEAWYAYEDILSRPHMADFAASMGKKGVRRQICPDWATVKPLIVEVLSELKGA